MQIYGIKQFYTTYIFNRIILIKKIKGEKNMNVGLFSISK